MNRIESFQARVSEQGRSMIEYTADWVEWSARKSLEIAEDMAEFTVAQLRLPVEAEDFADYRVALSDSYGELGEELKRHGDDYVSKLKGVPAEIRAIFEPGEKVARKAPAKPKTAKPKTVKKTARPAKDEARA